MVENGRQLTVFGAGYKADFECPLSIGALSDRGAALNWCQAQAIVVAESSPLPQAKGLRSPVPTAYSDNTTSAFLFRIPSCTMSLDQSHNYPLSISTIHL